MIDDVFMRVRKATRPGFEFGPVGPRDHQQIARTISALERGEAETPLSETLRRAVSRSVKPPVVRSPAPAVPASRADRRTAAAIRAQYRAQHRRVAMDPTRRRSGGWQLADHGSLAAEQLFALARRGGTCRAGLAVLNLLRLQISTSRCREPASARATRALSTSWTSPCMS
jgi:hypothetical protein